MKRTLLLLFAAIIATIQATAQAPSKMSYQAVVRDAANTLIHSAPVGIRISIVQGSPNGTAVYVENQSATTNANGLITIEIGNGTVTTGTFSAIQWANGPYFIKTETDPSGGTNYTITGTSQLLSVPYALYAETSGTAGPQGPPGADGNDGLTTSVNNVSHVNGNITLTPTDIGLGNVENTADLDKPISQSTQTALGSKANLDSPVLTGTPQAPTANVGDNSDLIATTGFVTNTLNSSVANYLPLAGGTLTGGFIGTNATFNNDLNVSGYSVFGSNISETTPRLKLIGLSSDGLDGGGGLEIGDGGAVRLRIFRTPFNSFNISTLGSLSENIGINANYNPSYTLDINGSLRTKSHASIEGNLDATGNFTANSGALAGNLSVSGNSIVGSNTGLTTPSLKLVGYSSDGVDGGGGLEIGDGGAVRMRIFRTSSNNFNISTVGSFYEYLGINANYDPAYTLDINGTLRTKSNAVVEGDLSISGTPTAPTASTGTNNNQLATTEFVTNAINASGVRTVLDGGSITLDASASGKLITTQWGALPNFPDNLPDGFTCDLINYSNFPFTTNNLSSAYFFTPVTGWNNGVGITSFNIPSGGTVRINATTINGQKCYFVTGDVN